MSTVGILKHYVHDYLFHSLRTDFIGRNGVGKSIIADMLQLMFVYDTDLIRFGTDGVKKEERSVYKLPYKLNHAYCFLNIEVKVGKFITIGIVIPAAKGTRIAPFLISKTAEMGLDIDKHVIVESELLFANDFKINNSVPDLKELSEMLHAQRKLFLIPFKTKEDVKRYYQFLSDKNILSINLTVKENLKAFAKVIQSFSKAKSFDLSPNKASKSLKDFLFEDKDEDLINNYESQQREMDKLLRSFASLDRDINLLKTKQKQLSSLKNLDGERQQLMKEMKTAEIVVLYLLLDELREDERQTGELLAIARSEKLSTEKATERLPNIRKMVMRAYEQSQDHDRLINEHEEATKQADSLDRELTDLKILKAALKTPTWPEPFPTIDISVRSSSDLKIILPLADKYVRGYQRLSDIEEASQRQRSEIASIVVELEKEIKQLDSLLAILKGNHGDSVLGWGLQHQDALSKEQANALLHFATSVTQKPKNPIGGERYFLAKELFAELLLEQDKVNNGFWLKMGSVREFIPYRPDAGPLMDTKRKQQSLQLLIDQLNKSKAGLQGRLNAGTLASQGKEYDRELLGVEYDLYLMDYGNVDRIRQAVACSFQLDEKLQQLQNTHEAAKKAQLSARALLPRNLKFDEPEVMKKDVKAIQKIHFNRTQRLTAFETNIQTRKTKAETESNDAYQKQLELIKSISDNQTNLSALQAAYFATYVENVELNTEITVPVDTLKIQLNSAEQEYRFTYKQSVENFMETANSTNVAVNLEISTDNYSFSVLEQALLGSKIRHTDEIVPALQQANQARLDMADELKNNMIKIFDQTVARYKKFKDLINRVNLFFKKRKISDQFFFSVEFHKHSRLNIELVEEIGVQMRQAAKQNELAFDKPVSAFIEDFFKLKTKMQDNVPIEHLLNPKTYFELSIKLTDESGVEVPGSTGEAYSAIALLGIARLSVVQEDAKPGLRFIILEELGSLDHANFNTFPAIAKEFNYQIITMAPHAYRSDLADEWYAHHLIKGIVDPNVNFYPTMSYFKTKDHSKQLVPYLKSLKNELA